MSTFKTTVLTVATTLCLINVATAQSSCSGDYCDKNRVPTHTVRHYGHGYGYRHGGYGYYSRHANYLHGKADVIRSQALANLLNAQAWTQAEVAREHNMKNSVVALHTRQERRHINTVSRFGKLHAKAAERKALQAEMVHVALANGIDPSQPARMAPQELNQATGELAWPLLLQNAHFDRARGPVDNAFAMRAKFGSIHPDDYIPLRNWIERIKAELNKSVDTLPKEDYAQSQDFLRRLIIEVRLPLPQPVGETQLVSK